MSAKVAYLQARKDGLPYDGLAFSAFEGFQQLGYDTRFFTNSDMILGKITPTPETPLVGTMDTIRAVWGRMGVAPPTPIDYPKSLQKFLGRKMFPTTLGRLKQKEPYRTPYHHWEVQYPLFVKPAAHQKLFTGFVAKSDEDFTHLDYLPEDTNVWWAQHATFHTEARVFVYEGKIIHVARYEGDPFLALDSDTVKKAVNMYEESGQAPVAYAADFALATFLNWQLEDEYGPPISTDTILVEVNDAWALGPYTLDPQSYALMLADRWKEICADK